MAGLAKALGRRQKRVARNGKKGKANSLQQASAALDEKSSGGPLASQQPASRAADPQEANEAAKDHSGNNSIQILIEQVCKRCLLDHGRYGVLNLREILTTFASTPCCTLLQCSSQECASAVNLSSSTLVSPKGWAASASEDRQKI